jgi:hypothetical protein
MAVFCPGCGSKISVQPESPGGNVECPRCQSTFATAGLKSADGAPPPKRFRPKKAGGSKLGVVAIVMSVLLVVIVGAATTLYFTGHLGRWFGGSGSITGGPNQPAWQEYTNAEGRFRILFPGTPTRDTIPPPSRLKAGAKPTVVSFTVGAPDVTYSVAFEDFGGSETPEQFIDKQRTELTAGRGGKLTSEKDVTSGQNKGKEFIVEASKSGAVHMRFIVAGRRLYKVMALGTAKPLDSRDVAKFFDSFRIK